MSKKISGHFLDVRALVKVDHDNPIDVYAAERLAQLEADMFTRETMNMIEISFVSLVQKREILRRFNLFLLMGMIF